MVEKQIAVAVLRRHGETAPQVIVSRCLALRREDDPFILPAMGVGQPEIGQRRRPDVRFAARQEAVGVPLLERVYPEQFPGGASFGRDTFFEDGGTAAGEHERISRVQLGDQRVALGDLLPDALRLVTDAGPSFRLEPIPDRRIGIGAQRLAHLLVTLDVSLPVQPGRLDQGIR
jgi:hypothetical protein